MLAKALANSDLHFESQEDKSKAASELQQSHQSELYIGKIEQAVRLTLMRGSISAKLESKSIVVKSDNPAKNQVDKPDH